MAPNTVRPRHQYRRLLALIAPPAVYSIAIADILSSFGTQNHTQDNRDPNHQVTDSFRA
jgi:hypothetical protein